MGEDSFWLQWLILILLSSTSIVFWCLTIFKTSTHVKKRKKKCVMIRKFTLRNKTSFSLVLLIGSLDFLTSPCIIPSLNRDKQKQKNIHPSDPHCWLNKKLGKLKHNKFKSDLRLSVTKFEYFSHFKLFLKKENTQRKKNGENCWNLCFKIIV